MPERNNQLAGWTARARAFLIDAGKAQNESRQVETIRSARVLIDEFQAARLPADDVATNMLLEELATICRDRKAAEFYAARRFRRAEIAYFAAAEGLARARFYLGEHDSALGFLNRVPEDRLSKAGLNRRDTLLRARSLAGASRIAGALLNGPDQTFLSAGDVPTLVDAWPARRLGGIAALLAALGISGLVDPSADAAEPSTNVATHPALVFCGGFKWSGASAVRDYLCDFETVASFPATLRPFSDPEFSIRSLSDHFEEARDTRSRTKLLREARGFVLEKILGLNPGEVSSRRADAKWKTSVAALGNRPLDDIFGGSGKRFVHALLTAQDEFPRQALQDLVAGIAAATTPPDTRVCVMDSVLRAPDCAMLGLMAKASMLAVFRDPRDMYVTHVVRGGWTQGVEPYIAELAGMLAKWNAGSGPDVTRVQYERFILSSRYRTEIGRQVLRSGGTLRATTGFDAADSVTNIGIHSNFEDQAAIARLESAFPDLCIQSPEGLFEDA
jgi:hypothetical protein